MILENLVDSQPIGCLFRESDIAELTHGDAVAHPRP